MSAALDLRDHRVLAALRVFDPLRGTTIDERLELDAPGLRLRRSSSALQVVVGADHPALNAHAGAFAAPPVLPAPGALQFQVTVRDPSRRWLPRVAAFSLPRDADARLRDPRLRDPALLDPDLIAQRERLPRSLFAPIEVPLLPAPAHPLEPWWCVLRVHVERLVDGQSVAVRGALLRAWRLRDVNGVAMVEVLALGMSDERGEALVAAAGLPAHTFIGEHGQQLGEDGNDDDPDAPVVTADTAVTLDAIADPDAGWPLDPDALAARRGGPGLLTAAMPTALRAGSTASIRLTLQLVP